MSHLKCAPRTTFLFAIGVLLIAVLLCTVFHGYGYDDPYITFRYAQNLLSGSGFVYNVGEPVLSTTSPGYALLLATLGLIYRNMPLLGNILSALGLGLGAMALYLWACQAKQPFAGAVAGVLFLTSPLLVSTFGSEMCLYVGMALCGLYLQVTGRGGRAMACMGLATMIRPDATLVAGMIALRLLEKERRIPWRPIGIYVAILLPWIAYGLWVFGSPIPGTLFTKPAQARMAISPSFVGGAWKMLLAYARWPLCWLFLPFGALGLWQIATRKRTWLMLLAWTACHFLSYTMLRVSRYFWYYAPLVPGILASVGVGLDWVREQLLSRRSATLWRRGLIAVLLAGVLWPNLWVLRNIYTHPDRRLAIYRQAGQWIDANLPARASVGTLEVGIIGYYARRRMVDFAGLIQPEVSSQMRQETTYQDAARWAMQRYHPDHLLVDPSWFPDLQTTILALCQPLHTFVQDRYQGELILYACDWE